MVKVYVAGPMRNRPRFNFDAFEDAARMLRADGYEVVSPAEHDIEEGFDPDGTIEGQGFDVPAALAWDLAQIALEVDAVVLLPGWSSSAGVAAEIATARAVGKPVYEFVESEPGCYKLTVLEAA